MSRLKSFLSFSGRANRHDLLIISLVLTALELAKLAVPLPALAGQVLAGAILWVGLAAMARRLHDIGRSAWWLLGGVAFCFGWTAVVVILTIALLGLPALTPGNPLYPVSLGTAFLAPLGALLWLHLARGEFGVNRFGPPRPVAEAETPVAAGTIS
jgi:uncharacterized membrane protein YhaH (DUF805 family)